MGIFSRKQEHSYSLKQLLDDRTAVALGLIDDKLERLINALPDTQDRINEAIKDPATKAAVLENWYIDPDGMIDSPTLMELRRVYSNAREKEKAVLNVAAAQARDAVATTLAAAHSAGTTDDLPDFINLPAVKALLDA